MARKRGFGWLLRWYPRWFRDRHGVELQAFWTRQAGEPRYAGRMGVVKLWLHLTWDAVSGGLRRRLMGGEGRAAHRSGTEVAQDVRYALRSVRRAPLHAMVVVITLGLGIGATTSILGIVDAVILKPLPYPSSSELVYVARVDGDGLANVSWPDFRDWREQATGFAGLAAWYEAAADFRWVDGAEELTGAGVTRDMFEVLGVAPLLGRTFTVEEDRLGGPAAIILSWGLWQRRFGGDPGVTGAVVTVGGEPVEVVGVMPRGFAFPTEDTEYWEPVQDDELLQNAGLPTGSRTLVFLDVVGRLGGPVETAQSELSSLADRLWDEAGIDPGRRLPVTIGSLHERTVGDVRSTLVMLLGAVGLVLLVACANVASLALSRAMGRANELAVRVALGAGRRRLIRQLMTESMVLALAAGAAGVGVAWGITRLVLLAAPAGVPRLSAVSTGPATLAFAALVTVVSGLLFGVVPAVRATRGLALGGLARSSRGGVSDRRMMRPQQMLAVFQVALAVALLSGAVLLIRSYARLMAVEPGFAVEGVVIANVSPPEDRYAEPEAVEAFYATLLERARSLPGVAAATTTYSPPLTGNGFRTTIEIEGQAESEDDRNWIQTVVARDGYFETTGTPLVRGRDFGSGDRLGAEPVVIVNESMADRFWPGEDPIGKRFRMTSGLSGSMGGFDRRFFPPDWFTVIGVAGDVRRLGLDQAPVAEYYRPHSQVPWAFQYLVIRTAGPTADMGRTIRELVRGLDPAVPAGEVRTVRSTVRDAVAEWRFRMQLLAAFGVTTCLLAMLGVYAVMALAVSRRQRELGVRMALGATSGELLLQVLRRGLGLAAAGAAAGLLIAVAGSGVLETMLFEVGTGDPLTYAAVVGVTAGVALVASWVPAWRASRIDPARSLGQE